MFSMRGFALCAFALVLCAKFALVLVPVLGAEFDHPCNSSATLARPWTLTLTLTLALPWPLCVLFLSRSHMFRERSTRAGDLYRACALRSDCPCDVGVSNAALSVRHVHYGHHVLLRAAAMR
jgi:hypothetical protein